MGGEETIDVVVQPVIHSRRELAGKYLGHTKTRIEKQRHKNWFSRTYVKFFYDQRPDLVCSKTRKHHWEKLHSPQRFIQALFCYIGPPSHLLRNLRLPLALVTFITLAAAVYHILRTTTFPNMPRLDASDNLRNIYSLGSFAVSLLLAMRLNRTYERFWLARRSFGGIGMNNGQAANWMAVWCDDAALVVRIVVVVYICLHTNYLSSLHTDHHRSSLLYR
jgi:hypothetical protein